MARGYTTRKLEVWSLHAHQNDEAVEDYEALFQALSRMKPQSRVWEDDEKAIALPRLQLRRGKILFTAYEGPRGQPIIFDTEAATERTQALEPGEIVATRTHGLIDLNSREAIIEYNHRGAKASDIAIVLGASGRRLRSWKTLYIELSPKVAESFAEGVDAFERVRVAGFRIARPNADWTDWDDRFAESAADSDAQSAQVEYNAKRGASLSKKDGVVPFIKARAADGVSALKNAFVSGTRAGESAETKITLADHKEHQKVAVRLDQNKQVDDRAISRRLMEYDVERHGRSARRPRRSDRRKRGKSTR
jgi:hypothetical protein